MCSIDTKYFKGFMQEEPIETTPEPETKSTMSPAKLAVGAGVVVALGALAYTAVSGNLMGGTYKDGTYTAVGTYISPGGDEEVGVTLTLKDNVITDATVEPKATRPNSVKFQGVFNENYKQFVVGKNINKVKLDKVSGSSLTPQGFMNALKQIKSQAKV